MRSCKNFRTLLDLLRLHCFPSQMDSHSYSGGRFRLMGVHGFGDEGLLISDRHYRGIGSLAAVSIATDQPLPLVAIRLMPPLRIEAQHSRIGGCALRPTSRATERRTYCDKNEDNQQLPYRLRLHATILVGLGQTNRPKSGEFGNNTPLRDPGQSATGGCGHENTQAQTRLRIHRRVSNSAV